MMKPQDSPPEDAAAARAWMSALADGRADACGPALQAWASDADARRSWHAYQLIGDVLRSEGLAIPAQHDENFLGALRQRLAQEPVVLAPSASQAAPVAAKVRGRVAPRWGVAAAAAGFLMVGGAVLMLQRVPAESPLAAIGPARSAAGKPVVVSTLPSQARLNTVPPGPALASSGAEPELAQWRMLDGQVRRDARLETYLRAHRAHSAAAGRVETVVLER